MSQRDQGEASEVEEVKETEGEEEKELNNGSRIQEDTGLTA